MRLSTSLLASIGLAGAVAAQTNNQLELYSGTTNFTTRSALAGASEGEICQRYPASAFNGIGQTLDANGQPVNRCTGIMLVLQDQSGITQEAFEVGLKGDDPLAPGNVDPTNDLVRAGPFNTPASTATGAVAWIFTITLGTPFDGLAAQGDTWAFCDVPANPAWTADGLSIHMSGWTATPFADNPNATATIPNFVNVIDQTAIINGSTPQAAVLVNNTRFQRIWLMTPASVLHLGADIDPNAQVAPNPNFGCAGLYPDQNTGRRDGLAFRVRDANLANTAVTILGTFGPTTSLPPIPLSGFVPGSVGSIYLSFPLLSDAFATGVSDPTGVFQQTTFAFPFALAAPVGKMSFQAFHLDFANARIVASNSSTFDAQ
jgi:hypothetical protein